MLLPFQGFPIPSLQRGSRSPSSAPPAGRGERLTDFLTPSGGRGWEIPGRRGALLPRHPEKSERLFSAFPDLPSSREGYPLFLKRQRGERAEESLNFSLGAGGEKCSPPSRDFPSPPSKGGQEVRQALPSPSSQSSPWRESSQLPCDRATLPVGRGERLTDFLTPSGGRGWEIPGRGGALLPPAPREK